MPGFTNLLVVVAIAFACPFLLGLFPRVRLPSVVLEIVAGIVAGPALLGIVEIDGSVEVVAILGLAFLLFLAGLEIDFDRLRGQRCGSPPSATRSPSPSRSPSRCCCVPAGSSRRRCSSRSSCAPRRSA